MLFLMITWLLLSLVCWSIGTLILNCLSIDCFQRLGDRIILAIWLGILFLPWAMLTVSLLFPLTPWVGGIVALILVSASLSHQTTRQEISYSFKIFLNLSSTWQIIFLLLTFLIAFLSSQPVSWSDTGFYHYQAIEWFAKYGTVPGLALIHTRLGTSSSWFTLLAPFNAGVFTERITPLLGGFVYLLALIQLTININRILHKKAGVNDWFLVFCLFFVIPNSFKLTLPFSAAPDPPVILMCILTAWIILIISQSTQTIKTRVSLLLLILATLTIAIRLSALPLLLLSFGFYILNQKNKLLAFVTGSIISLLFLMPIFIFNFITSGCLIFPVSRLCFDFPWSVGVEAAQEYYKVIQEWNQWYVPFNKPPDAQPGDWIWPWLGFETPFLFIIISSIVALIIIFKQPELFRIKGKNYLVFLAILGTIYVLHSAPTWRFGIGYSCLLPALVLARYCSEKSRFKFLAIIVVSGGANLLWIPSFSLLLLIGITITIALIVYYVLIENTKQQLLIFFALLLSVSLLGPVRHYLITRYGIYQFNILLPPSLSSTYNTSNFQHKRVNDIDYLAPSQDVGLCWSAPLPCTHALTHEKIRLRNHQQGIGGGFVRSDRPQN